MVTISKTAPDGAHLSRKSTGQGSCIQSKWQHMKVVEDIREPLGLKGTTIAVLRAALSFIRSDDISAERHETHVCFASNASLAKRAHVSVQTVERHVSKLVAAGLLVRVSSGNGKRWARRDGQGRIVFATGLSVLPMMQRHQEFLDLAKQQEAAQLQLTLLRDRCVTALAELATTAANATPIAHLRDRARSILRRKPNAEALNALLAEITKELQGNTPGKPNDLTDDLRDSDPQIEGHKETSLTQSVDTATKQTPEVSQSDMERCYPKLCAELRLAPNHQACQRLMDDLAAYLGMGSLWAEIKDMGPAMSFMVLGYVFERVDHIHSPKAYVRRLLQDLKAEKVGWESLLKRPQRRFKAGLGRFEPTTDRIHATA